MEDQKGRIAAIYAALDPTRQQQLADHAQQLIEDQKEEK